MAEAWKSYSWFSSLKWSMIWEMGLITDEKLRERSAMPFVDRIKIPLLVIHGSQDDRADTAKAEEFVRQVNQAGGRAEFLILNSEHVIPMEKIKSEMDSFFKRQLAAIR